MGNSFLPASIKIYLQHIILKLLPSLTILLSIKQFLFITLLISVHHIYAYELTGLNVHGSLSQTYLNSDKNDFLIANSSKGTFQWTEAVLNVSKNYNNWNFGVQGLVRDFGEEGNFRLDLDWGYVDYSVNEKIGFRLGQAKLPFGLYNEYHDVDSARMEAMLPQVFIPEDYRNVSAAYQGLAIYGTLSSVDYGSLEYQIYAGTNYIHDDFFLVRGMRNNFNSPNTKMNTHLLQGGSLLWNTPIENLRFGYNHLHYKGSFNIAFNHPLAGRIIDDKGVNFDINWHLFGFDYSTGDWSYSAEFLHRSDKNKYGSILSPLFQKVYAQHSTTVSYYLTIRRQLTFDWGIFCSYGELQADIAKDNAPPSEYLKELSFGTRYDLRPNLILKAQVNSYRGHNGVLNTSNQEADWSLFTARISVLF